MEKIYSKGKMRNYRDTVKEQLRKVMWKHMSVGSVLDSLSFCQTMWKDY
jgi:hypothetical protein